jgi:hypothetical protein
MMLKSSTVSVVALLALLLCGHPLAAQTLDDEFADDFPADPLPYVGFGAGFTPTFIFMDLTELNSLAVRFSVDELSGPLSAFGANIIFTPVFIPNVRVGFLALGGYHRSSRPISIEGEVYQRTLRFGIRFQGGLQAEYAIPIVRRFAVFPSLGLGWGSYSLEMSQAHRDGEDFRDVSDPRRFGRDPISVLQNLNRQVRLINFHGFIYPAVHLEYAFTGTIMLRASAGYHLGVLDDNWVDEGDTEYTNVGSINANGVALQAGVFLGLFQQ